MPSGTDETYDQPNILLITTDQQRYDTVGRGAPDFLRTPHTDFLQRQGIEFTRAYATTPLCGPARASIMTGQRPFDHGLCQNGPGRRVMDRDGTLPTCLWNEGYYTAAVGKFVHGGQNLHGFGEHHGFGAYNRDRKRAGKRVDMRHGIGMTDSHPAIDNPDADQTRSAWVVDRSIDYIRDRDRSRPFFLWAGFLYPHPPFSPPEEFFDMYRHPDCPIPDPVLGDWVTDEPMAIEKRRQSFNHLPFDDDWTLRDMRAAYYGLCTHIDYQLGRLFGALYDEGILDETLILFTTDHGEYLGDHGLSGKNFFHDQSARLPFLLRLPRTWEDRMAGTATDTIVQLDDVLPTLVSAGGGDPPAHATGRDLVALARGDPDVETRDYAEGVGVGACSHAGLTDGRWKYIWYSEGAYEQLFDLEADPDETTNLANGDLDGQALSKRNELREELRRRHADRGRFGHDDQYYFTDDDDDLIGFPEGGPTPDGWNVDIWDPKERNTQMLHARR